MSYVEVGRPITTGTGEATVDTSINMIAQDIVATEVTVRDTLSKLAPTHGRSIVREPPIDIYDEGDRIVLIVDMPGIPKENIKVRVSVDSVEISAIPQNVNNGRILRAERLANFKIYRKVQLPYRIKIGEVRAYLKDGVLYIYLPKLTDTTESLDITIE